MLLRATLHTTVMLALIAIVLLAAAGDWRWPQAWIFVGELGAALYLGNVWLARHDPALLEQRLSPKLRLEQRGWDRAFMPGVTLAFVGWMVLIGMDAQRFGWSHVLPALQGLGAVLVGLFLFLIGQTFRYNSFAVTQVRTQDDRAQRVISNGPYRFVRHPMYAGFVCLFFGMPLLLGSWCGVLLAPLLVMATGLRAVGEERMLRRELPGYSTYAGRVRFRLIPGLW